MSHPFSSAEKGAAEGRFTGIIPAAFGNCPIFSWFRRCDRDSSPLQCSSYENQSGVGFFFHLIHVTVDPSKCFLTSFKAVPMGNPASREWHLHYGAEIGQMVPCQGYQSPGDLLDIHGSNICELWKASIHMYILNLSCIFSPEPSRVQ